MNLRGTSRGQLRAAGDDDENLFYKQLKLTQKMP